MFDVLDKHLENYVFVQTSFYRIFKFYINGTEFNLKFEKNNKRINLHYFNNKFFDGIILHKRFYKSEFGEFLEFFKFVSQHKDNLNKRFYIEIAYDPLDNFKAHIVLRLYVEDKLSILFFPCQNKYSIILDSINLSKDEYYKLMSSLKKYIPDNYTYAYCKIEHLTYLMDVYKQYCKIVMKKVFNNVNLSSKIHKLISMLDKYETTYGLDNKYFKILKLIYNESKMAKRGYEHFRRIYFNETNVNVDLCFDYICNTAKYTIVFYGITHKMYMYEFDKLI